MKTVKSEGHLDDVQHDHPAFGIISANRIQGGHSPMFQSSVKNHNFISIKVKRASMSRGLNNDYVYERNQIVEVHLTEAQWAHFVSSLNMGMGSPCTIDWVQGEGDIPDIEQDGVRQTFEAEMQELADETAKVARDLEGALAKLLEKKSITKADIREFHEMVREISWRMPDSMGFMQGQFHKAMEKVVEESKAELEAHVLNIVHQTGLTVLLEQKPTMAIDHTEEGDDS